MTISKEAGQFRLVGTESEIIELCSKLLSKIPKINAEAVYSFGLTEERVTAKGANFYPSALIINIMEEDVDCPECGNGPGM